MWPAGSGWHSVSSRKRTPTGEDLCDASKVLIVQIVLRPALGEVLQTAAESGAPPTHHGACHERKLPAPRGSFVLYHTDGTARARVRARARGPLTASAPPAAPERNEGLGTIVLEAADAAGLQSGAGRLLRELRMPPPPHAASVVPRADSQRSRDEDISARGAIQDPATLIRASTLSASAPPPPPPPSHSRGMLHKVLGSTDLCVRHDGSQELWKLRGHQIPCSRHPLQFRTRPQFERFVSLSSSLLGVEPNPAQCSCGAKFSLK
jgi:hypothetical protein